MQTSTSILGDASRSCHKISLSFFVLSFTFHRLGGSLLCMNWEGRLPWMADGRFVESSDAKCKWAGKQREEHTDLIPYSANRPNDPQSGRKLVARNPVTIREMPPFRSFFANQIKMQNTECKMYCPWRTMGILWTRSTVSGIYSPFVIRNRISSRKGLFRI